jgi:enamine deaminase RidA (YjgF/YER057c/UK114 family)
VSGQLPIDRDGKREPGLSFEEQARLTLGNLLAILREAGSSPERVLKVTAYIVGVSNWAEFNTVYAELFGDSRPARAVVPVPELHHGFLLEVEAIAYR